MSCHWSTIEHVHHSCWILFTLFGKLTNKTSCRVSLASSDYAPSRQQTTPPVQPKTIEVKRSPSSKEYTYFDNLDRAEYVSYSFFSEGLPLWNHHLSLIHVEGNTTIVKKGKIGWKKSSVGFVDSYTQKLVVLELHWMCNYSLITV